MVRGPSNIVCGQRRSGHPAAIISYMRLLRRSVRGEAPRCNHSARRDIRLRLIALAVIKNWSLPRERAALPFTPAGRPYYVFAACALAND